ncbi:uncharacterized protein N0V89_003413 [Didymosphaeria variabile]|uniref:Uncharacterized protein n=1 Tax=Didymosphaeria variabile TaxID=1932322 RepID=A0A9W8XNP0_9PLEO|nr:uncharacterized protein N0V89_003413 [Didymosphaeria variabile]KAJ4355397.1 hypothetical protein N0V89_003413 [Didymosphaeria variabile]
MPPSPSLSSSSTRPNFTFPTLESISNTEFTFRSLPRPEAPLSFLPGSSPSPLWKRRRAIADVDGEHSCLHKKKRRLRLFLITSRLSPQYSYPATNIVDRGSSKIAVWAKQRALGRNILRKAAILNRIRRQSISALETAGGMGRVLVEQEKEQEQLHLAKLTLMYGSHDSATQPIGKDSIGLPEVVETRNGEQIRSAESSPANSTGSPSPPLRACDEDGAREYRSPNDAYADYNALSKLPRPVHLPLPPSPLGLSNYDALDLEDEIPDPYSHLDEEYEAEEQEEAGLENPFAPCFPFPCDDVDTRRASQQSHGNASILEPEEPAVAGYDQVEEGSDVLWPTSRQNHDRSADTEPPSSSSPDFQAPSANAFSDAIPQSPNTSSLLGPTSSSPNFAGLYVTSDVEERKVNANHAIEMEKEKERQRRLMFMSFGS